MELLEYQKYLITTKAALKRIQPTFSYVKLEEAFAL